MSKINLHQLPVHPTITTGYAKSSPMVLADELDQVTGELEDKVSRISEMVNAIRDRHERAVRAGTESAEENHDTRMLLAASLVTLESAEQRVDDVSAWTGADCLPGQGGEAEDEERSYGPVIGGAA